MQQLLEAKKTEKILDSDIQEVLNTITNGMLLLGIKGEKLPTEFEIRYMVQMMRKDYGNLPIGEFKLAFELAVKDKLDENSETYQNFSVLYLSRLMTSYARWARQQSYNLPYEEPTQIGGPKVDDEEVLNMALEIYKINKDWEHIYCGLRCFNILHKRNLITDFEGTLQRTEDAIKKNYIYSSQKEKKEMYRLLEDDEYMELQCRRKAVSEYFDNKLKN